MGRAVGLGVGGFFVLFALAFGSHEPLFIGLGVVLASIALGKRKPGSALSPTSKRALALGFAAPIMLAAILSGAPYLAVVGMFLILVSALGWNRNVAPPGDGPGHGTRLGIEPAAPSGQPTAPSPEIATIGIRPGPFKVMLLSAGQNRFEVIKAIHQVLGVSLEKAVQMTRDTPSALADRVSGADGDRIKELLAPLGATVEVVMPAPKPAVSSSSGFDLILKSPGPKKMILRQALKNVLGLDLLEAYNAVEQTPSVIKTGIARQDAERFRAVLEEQGAVVQVQPTQPAQQEQTT